jgi:hypothetical protein
MAIHPQRLQLAVVLLGMTAALTFSPPVLAQPWYVSMLKDLDACQERAWRDCAEAESFTCFTIRSVALDACTALCEHTLAERTTVGAQRLRADEFACVTSESHEEPGFTCKDRAAWRQAEISARADAFDFALHEYPYLLKLTFSEIVERVYRVAERGFLARGGCALISDEGRSLTLLNVTAQALNHIRSVGAGSSRWASAQAWSLELLRAGRR